MRIEKSINLPYLIPTTIPKEELKLARANYDQSHKKLNLKEIRKQNVQFNKRRIT